MGDSAVLSDVFYSKAPLPQRVDIINIKDNKNDQMYWMLSVESHLQKNEEQQTNQRTLAPYEDNETEMVDCCDLEDNYEINPTKSGKYITSFYVPSALLPVIVGARGLKLRELQNSTQTLIKVPKPDETGKVKITGNSERSVASARTQIVLLLLNKREGMKVTHFISIPIYSDEIRANFQKFKDDIINGSPTRGIDESIFQDVNKFHLTIVTLTLLDEQEIDRAKSILDSCQENFRSLFAGKRPPLITLRGVEIMNDDPSDVDVLYGKVQLGSDEDTEKLQTLADEILTTFYKNGFLRRQYETVKLHVTLMNSLFRKSEDYDPAQKTNTKRKSFDATFIVETYKDFYFGRTALRDIHLSVRFTTSKNKYYESVATINL